VAGGVELTTPNRKQHTLRVTGLELIGGWRRVDLLPGLNVVRGDITTGKTTFIRLVRAFLASIPKHLPPETAQIRGLRGNVVLGDHAWDVYRPLVTTAGTPVEVASSAQGDDGVALRLPASGEGGYGEFVLTQLNLPVVSVPRARREPTNDLTPVTINDWLLYSVVTGDELDTQVFGHRDPFRDLKRRWVFEIAYGLYDEALATLAARLRRLDIEIAAAETEAEVIRQFLAGTTVGKPEELEADLVSLQNRSEGLRAQAAALTTSGIAEPGGEIAGVRANLLTSRRQLDELGEEERQARAHLGELRDLEKQLSTLSQRLTRSIVAGEWMIDFDFVVCPRCGSDVDRHRTEDLLCYLCEQPEPKVAPSQETLIREQDRVVSQVEETKQLIDERQAFLNGLEAEAVRRSVELGALSGRLDALTNDFVSSRAAELQAVAAEGATVDANSVDEPLPRVLSATGSGFRATRASPRQQGCP